MPTELPPPDTAAEVIFYDGAGQEVDRFRVSAGSSFAGGVPVDARTFCVKGPAVVPSGRG